MNFVDAVGWLIRNVIRQALGMPANSIRPAHQTFPVGSQAAEFGTVQIQQAAVMDPNIVEALNEVGSIDYALEALHEFTASVQFYKAAGHVDSQGIPSQSYGAFEKAVRIGTLLCLPENIQRLQTYGLGFVRSSTPKDLTGVADSFWESRGQVDLIFGVVNKEAATVAILQAADITLQVAQVGGQTDTITIEVTQ